MEFGGRHGLIKKKDYKSWVDFLPVVERVDPVRLDVAGARRREDLGVFVEDVQRGDAGHAEEAQQEVDAKLVFVVDRVPKISLVFYFDNKFNKEREKYQGMMLK